jgi:2-polyprenyl-3-methyl-5-hydroxy-6-metoxy-1,4-benzoquinol methylase
MANCDICGSADYTPLGFDPRVVVCGECGFVYVPNRRSPAEIATVWDEMWGETYSAQWPMIKARLTYVNEWLDFNFNLAGKKVMDIGAGDGEFLKMVRLKDAEPYGVEPAKENIKIIRDAHIPHYHGTIETLPAVGKFDLITILWTLENCGDCVNFLRRAKRSLKPGGSVVVATGSRIMVPYKKRISQYINRDNPPDSHCFRFSRRSLSNAMEMAGLEETVVNRYQDSDWLLIAAEPKEVGAEPDIIPENPEHILNFFNEWERTWP